MDAYSKIKDDLVSFVRTWTKTGIINNPQIGGDFFSNMESISSKYNFFKNEEEYILGFAKAYAKNQYLCTLPDGSLFQISYSFVMKNKRQRYVSKASLTYLPCVTEGVFDNDYIRLDYDVDNQNFFHPAAHLHVGFKGNFRLASNELLCFSEFFKFITYLYYPEIYLKLVGKDRIKHTLQTEEGKYTKQLPNSEELDDFVHLTTDKIK